MSTGLLHAMRGARALRLHPGQRRGPLPMLTFGAVFPVPAGFSHAHPLYALYRAANRVYHARSAAYRDRLGELPTPEWVDFVRDDVISNLLATVEVPLGPWRIRQYHFLDARRFWAWLPAHRAKAEAQLPLFKKTYKPKRRLS